jgi:DNA-binding transcriptional MerR regulator
MTDVLTITRLARRFRLSRTAVLHYERVGLLRASARSPAGYRLYSPADAGRLGEICRLRRAGLSLAAIGRALREPDTLASLLRLRLDELRGEIDARRAQQRIILGLLREPGVHAPVGVMNKARWTALLRAAGFDREDQRRWHADFERTAPDEHQAFLEFLCLPEDEVALVRDRARRAPRGRPPRR